MIQLPIDTIKNIHDYLDVNDLYMLYIYIPILFNDLSLYYKQKYEHTFIRTYQLKTYHRIINNKLMIPNWILLYLRTQMKRCIHCHIFLEFPHIFLPLYLCNSCKYISKYDSLKIISYRDSRIHYHVNFNDLDNLEYDIIPTSIPFIYNRVYLEIDIIDIMLKKFGSYENFYKYIKHKNMRDIRKHQNKIYRMLKHHI